MNSYIFIAKIDILAFRNKTKHVLRFMNTMGIMLAPTLFGKVEKIINLLLPMFNQLSIVTLYSIIPWIVHEVVYNRL